jgi:YggT family protein
VEVVGTILYTALSVFLFLLIARLVLEYVQIFARSWRPSGIMLVIAEVVYTATDPPLKVLRRILPPLRLGGIAIDLAFMALVLVVLVLRGVVRGVFN